MAGTLVIAQVRYKEDHEPYNRYLAAFPHIFAGSGGSVVAVEDNPDGLTGSDDGVDKLVVIRFDSKEAARSFFESPEYQRIAVDRDAGADVNIWMVAER